jgi:large subunit ribosomal protein L6
MMLLKNNNENELCVRVNYVDGNNLIFVGKYGKISIGIGGLTCINRKKQSFFLPSMELYRNFCKVLSVNAKGVMHGYYLELSFVGLGYRFLRFGSILYLKVGYAHYIKIVIPKFIHIFGYKKRLIIFGISEGDVCVFAHKIRNFRKPDIYKGKGIRFLNEVLEFKVGKQQQQ